MIALGHVTWLPALSFCYQRSVPRMVSTQQETVQGPGGGKESFRKLTDKHSMMKSKGRLGRWRVLVLPQVQ